ncbi:WCX domain-containing protein [Kroppenstedtia sanguinis]|uniref:WCX domain-containing protein n=1 Tax=Kroppenstedtia sanguinis TaxID=1380684 RepID=A0ABW4C8C8_9BACL
MTLSFDTEQEATETILGWGERMIVLEPVFLRQRVLEMATAVIKSYDSLE